jgi:hypothetical protein
MFTTVLPRQTRWALGASVVIALSSVSGQAAARVYAGSLLELDNFSIVFGEGSPGDAGGTGVTSLGFNISTTNTAVLNSSPVITVGNCTGTTIPSFSNDCAGVINAGQTWAPGASVAAPAEDSYAFFGPSNLDETFSRADSIINSAQVLGAATTSTDNIAEAQVQTVIGAAQSANSNAEISSTTNFTQTFTVGGPAFMVVDFDADPELQVEISSEAFPNATAEAEVVFTYIVSQDGTSNSVSWSPQGTVANDCVVTGFAVVTCVETDDGEDLNVPIQIGSIPSSDSYSVGGGFSDFGIEIDSLPAGNYTISVTEFKTVNVTNGPGVPLPAPLSLIGLGLIGLAWARKRLA